MIIFYLSVEPSIAFVISLVIESTFSLIFFVEQAEKINSVAKVKSKYFIYETPRLIFLQVYQKD